MFIGGSRAPSGGFAFPTGAETMHVHADLSLNFCIDVAGYGVLAIVVSWLLFRRASWTAYFLGVFMVGIADVSFTFLQLASGIIAISLPSVSGPVIWLIAAAVTPFGMPVIRGTGTREP